MDDLRCGIGGLPEGFRGEVRIALGDAGVAMPEDLLHGIQALSSAGIAMPQVVQADMRQSCLDTHSAPGFRDVGIGFFGKFVDEQMCVATLAIELLQDV